MMTEKRGLASKSKNSFNNSKTKIFILVILSILVFAASVSYVMAAGPSISTPANTIANGTGTYGTGDTFYFSDNRTMNETIWLRFNITFPTMAQSNASGINATVNCSGVGDVLTPLINATVISAESIADGYVVIYNASCKAVFTGSAQFYSASINITVTNSTGASAGGVLTSTAATVILYNMTTPPTAPNGCMRWGPETTNFSTINNFASVNVIFQMLGNISCFTCTDGPGVCGPGAQIMPPPGCPDGICGWMRNFTAVNKLNFTSLNLSNSTFYSILSQLPQAIQINVPASNARYASATTKVSFNSSFFRGLNTNATVELYGIPFKGKPDIVTDTGSVNNTEITLVPATDGITYNITFAVFGFSDYNATDVTAPKITAVYPLNASAITATNPALNISFNGTGTEVNVSTIKVNFSGTGISSIVQFTYLNFTCRNITSSGPSQGEVVYCMLNQSMTNATTSNGTYTLAAIVEDMGGDSGIRGNATLTFVSSTMPPEIAFTLPASLSYTNNTPFANFTLSLNSTTRILGHGINIYTINISMTFSSGTNFSMNGTNGTNFVKLTALANGAFDVWINFTGAQTLPNTTVVMNVTAQDNLSNTLPWTALTFYAVSDVTAPIISSVYPVNATAISNHRPKLNFTLNGTGTAINLASFVVNFSGTGATNLSLTAVNFTCYNESAGGATGSFVSCALNQSIVNATTPNGTYSVIVSVKDLGGAAGAGTGTGITQNYTLTFVSSTMPPTISFASPTSLSYTNNSPFVNFTLSFNSTAKISGNGITISTINISMTFPTGKNFSIIGTNESIKLTALANGEFDVFVNFTGAQILPNTTITMNVTAADNNSNTLPWTVLVFYTAGDVSAPIITSIYPANATAITSFNPRLNFTLNGTTSAINLSSFVVNFSGTGATNLSLTAVNFTCYNETTGGTTGSYVTCALNQAVTNITTLNGTYSAAVVVNDLGGAGGITQNYTLTFVSSTMLPTISFASPASASWNNNTPFLNFTLSFNSTVAIGGNGINLSTINISVFAPSASAIRFNINGTANESVKVTALANGAFAVFVNFTEAQILPNSSVIISVTAKDNLTNTLPLTNLSFYSDTKKPEVFMGTQSWQNTSDNTPTLIFNVTDTVSPNMTCNLTIDRTVNTSNIFILNTSVNSQANVTTALSDGIHFWGIYCWDVRGNMNITMNETPSLRNFTVDTTTPVFNWTIYNTRTGGYFKERGAGYQFNITDSPYVSNENSSLVASKIITQCYINGTIRESAALLNAKNASNEGSVVFKVLGNCTAGEVRLQSQGDRISIKVFANDSVDHELVTEINYTIDSVAPAITSPALSKTSYAQGENLTFTVTIVDAVSGTNTTNATINITGLYGASTNITTFSRKIVASGNSYSFQYNTSVLARGNYSLRGNVYATDFVLDGTNQNNTDLEKSLTAGGLNFTITDAGTGSGPTINKIIINQTVFVLNQTPSFNITLNITDVDNVSAVWVTFSGNTGISNTSNIFLGMAGPFYNRTNLNFINITGTSTTNVTMTVSANDTLGNLAVTKTMTLIVRATGAAIDAFNVNPSTAFVNQSPINVTATMFSYYGAPRFEVNLTGPVNSTGGSRTRALQGQVFNMSCAVSNATAFLYTCFNTTYFQTTTNDTGIYTFKTWTVVSGDVAAANTSVNYTVLPTASIPIGIITPSATLSFVGTNVNYTSDSNGLVATLPNGTVPLSVRDPTAGFITYLPNFNLSNVINITQLNLSVIVRNYTELNLMNQTNISTIATNISAVSLLNSSAVYAVVALELKTAQNESLFTSLEGSNNNVTIFCSEIGISNCSRMTVYTIPFNTSLNLTIGNSWTTNQRNYSTVNNSLTISGVVYSGKMFAIGEPVACTNNGATGTTAVPSTGCVFGETVYTNGYICSGAWQSTVCYTAPAATTTTTTTSTSSSDAPVGNITPTTSSTYLLGTITSGVERTVAVSLSGVPVTSIAITTNAQALNTELKIQKLTAAPTDAGNVPSKVYAYMSLTPKNIAPEIITTAKMSFSVTKSWMTQNGITEDQIVLSRYADGKWNELETAILSSDDTKVNYQAITPGFSYFAVTIRSAPLVAPEEQTEVPTKPAEKEETPVEQPPAEEQPPVKESKSWIAWLIAALVVVAGVAGYFIYRNMSEK